MHPLTLVPAPGRQGPGALPEGAIRRIELGPRRRADGMLAGETLVAGLGPGTELAQLRPYETGDDPRQLDPSASARTGVPHVRVHVPERAVTTWLVLDVSPSMAFGTGQRLKSDVAEGVAEVAARASVRRGGRIAVHLAAGGGGVEAGSSRSELAMERRSRSTAPRGGRGALAAVRRLVASGVAPDGPGHGPGLLPTLIRVGRLARARAVVVVVSDFRDADIAGTLRGLGRRHSVIGVEVCDPREGSLPDAGLLMLSDPETGEELEVDTTDPGVRSSYARAEADRRAAVADMLRRAGARHIELSTDRDWLRDLGRRMA